MCGMFNDVKVGDEVAICGRGSRLKRFATVSHVGKATFKVGGTLYMKSTGDERGGAYSYCLHSTTEMKEEDHKERCFLRARNELRDVLVTKENMHLVLDFLAKLDAHDEAQAAKGEPR